jgi:hypothetical protein
MGGVRFFADPSDLVLKSFDKLDVAVSSSGPGLYVRDRASLQILTADCVVTTEVDFNRRRIRKSQVAQYGDSLDFAFAWMRERMDDSV